MSDQTLQQYKKWAARWAVVDKRMEQLRQTELVNIDTSQAIINLSDAFEATLLHFIPSKTSGLVEQQRRFMQLAK